MVKENNKGAFEGKSYATPQHDNFLKEFANSGSSSLLEKYIREIYCHTEQILGLKENEQFFGKELKKISIKIIEWEPEKIIMNNGYYVGSIDLFVRTELTYEGLKEYHEFIFEFKPTMHSYSETLRQVKLYKEFLKKIDLKIKTHNRHGIVMTHSEIDEHFWDFFINEKIYICNLKELKKNLKIGEKEQ